MTCNFLFSDMWPHYMNHTDIVMMNYIYYKGASVILVSLQFRIHALYLVIVLYKKLEFYGVFLFSPLAELNQLLLRSGVNILYCFNS